ncbi:right-handed parallel beta-helix repeat-containing protein [Natrarchaeobius sp. A-rgal3]|uniref:right-handed parallel beta-helix repeat-containing protein n=1 Tax=Natrarchaeobius versutus TaxID=1679078 RepID=UPI0035102DF9
MVNQGQETTQRGLGVLIWIGIVGICGLCVVGGVAGIAAADAGDDPGVDRITPTQFDSDESDVLWETDENLTTGGAPTVVDGILVTTTGDTGGDGSVTAYDVGTGENRWSAEIPADGSPTVVDETVYVTGDDGVWALDLELGTLEWHVEFEDGTSSSRALGVDGESVYVGESIDATTDRLYALDAEDGSEQWSTETATIYSGPTVVDGTVYVGTADGLIAVDASDAEEQWTWDDYGVLEDRSAISEPTVSDGFLYVSLREGTEQGGYDRSTVAIDIETGEDEWTHAFDGPSGGDVSQTPTTPTASGESGEATVYVAFDGLYALDATDGSERWIDETTVWDAPTVADGTLFVPQSTDSGALRALDVTDEGSELWSVETGDRSDVIVVDGVLYVAVQVDETGETRLMAIDAGVSGSSSDARVMVGVQNNHHEWTGTVAETDPRVVDVAFDEGVSVGEEVSVTVTARNDRGQASTASFDLELGGETETVTLEVPAHGTNTVGSSISAPAAAGTYDVEIDDEVVGTVTVVDESDPIVRIVQPFYETWLEGESIQIAYEATNLGTEYVDENTTLSLEGPAFDGREDVAFVDAEGPSPGEERTYLLNTDEITDPGTYTAYLEDEEIGTFVVVSAPVYLADTNRLHDTIVSGIEAPVDPSAAAEASVDVRYENLHQDQQSVESELVAYDDEGIEVANDTSHFGVGGESAETERLSVSLVEAGTYDLEVDGEPVGEVEVLVDGVQDGDSIQDAIDAAQPGETILVGNGTYEESLTIAKELTLRSVSEGGAVLDGGGNLERAITVESDDVTVDGFRIEGYSGGDEVVFVNDDRFTLRNSTLVDNDGAALSINPNSDEFSIDTNEIRRNDAGIVDGDDWYPSDDGTITNNTIEDNQGLGIDLAGDDHGIAKNNVSGNGDVISATGSGLEIRQNNVTATDGIAIQVRGDSVVVDNMIENAEWGIHRDGTISMDGTVIEGNTFRDVFHAIPHAGDDSVVRDNEFSGTETDLVLDDAINATVTDNEFASGIRLDGVPEDLDQEPHDMSGNTVGGDPLVYATGEDDPDIDENAGQVILVDVTNVDFDGHSFSNVTAGIQVTHSDSVTVTGGEFTDLGDSGAISVWHSSSVTVDEIDVTDAERGVYVHESDGVTVSNGQFTAVGATAIYVDGVEELSIVGNDVQDANRGLHVLTADDLTVTDNVVEDSSTGVQFGRISIGGRSTSENVTFTNNTITGSSGDGVKQDHGSLTGDVTIRDSVVRDNGGVGMVLDVDGVSALVKNNTVRDNDGETGFDLSVEGETVTVTNNTVRNNEGEAGFALDVEGETATISHNVVTNNGADVGFDIEIETADGSIESNTVRHNVDGLAVTGVIATGVNVTITENIIEENTGTGLTVSDLFETVLVTENSIADNDGGLLYDGGDDVTLNATNNWWGAADGPSGDATDPETGDEAEGSGDSIATSDRWWLDDQSVRFSPWLEAPLVETGAITGTVTDADSEDSLEGATVVVTDDTGVIETAETDENGEYELVVPAGTYDLTVSADGYVEAEETDLEVTEGGVMTTDVSLHVGEASISGTVVDAETGDPVPDAELEVVEQVDVGQPDPAPDGFTTTLSTDANGEFELEAPPGVYEITVETLGYANGVSQDVELEAGEQQSLDDIELSSVPVLSGTVTDSETDEPIEGVEIESRFFASDPLYTTTTDADGEYAINLPEHHSQTPSVEFAADGYFSNTITADEALLGDPAGGDVELTVEREPGTVTGQVTTETDDPVEFTQVTTSDGSGSTSTNATGYYNLHLQPGTYTLEVTVEGTSPRSGTVEDVEVAEGETTTADIVASPGPLDPPSANLSVEIQPTASTTSATEGENLIVVTDIENTATEPVDSAVSLDVVDQTSAESMYGAGPRSVSLEPGEYVTETFTFESELEFDGAEAIVVAFPPGSDEPDDFDVIELSVSEADADRELESLSLSIDETTISEGSATSATVIATFDDGTTEDVTAETHLESDPADVVAIAGSTVVGEETGTATIIAVYQGETDSVEMTVAADEQPPSDPELESLSLSVDETTISEGSTASAMVIATFDDGTAEDVTDETSIESNSTDVVSVDGSMLVAEGSGVATVTATYDGEADSVEMTVEADEQELDPETELDVLEATVTPTQLDVGQEATIEATVENVGEGDGELLVPLEIGGEVVESTTVTLDAGESTDVAFAWTFENAGGFQVDVDGVDAGTVTVVEDADADVRIYGADVSQSAVVIGDTVSVTGDLLNDGGAGTVAVDLNVDGERVDTTTVEVGPGATPGGVEFEWTPTEADLPAGEDETNVTISLDGFIVGTVHVEHQYSDIQVVAVAASETELVEGEELHVIGSVSQAGNVEGTEEIELTATHQETGEETVVGSQEATIAPGYYHLGAINITYVPEDAGTYDLELGDRAAGTIEVEAAESDVQVIAASPSEVELIEGEEMHVIGSLYQAGNVEGTEEIELTATNTATGETTVVGSQEMTVAPNVYHLGAINITYVPEDAGTYDLELGDRDVGTIEVQAAESDIEVIAASPSEVELVEGEEMHVVGSVYQAGNVEGPEEIELTATNAETGEMTVLASQEMTVTPNVYHLGGLNVTFAPEEAGTYDLELGDRDAGTIEVEPAESDIQVIAASPSEVELIEGEEMHVVGSVYQSGNVAGPEEIELTATNTETGETTVVGSQEVTVAPNVYHLGALNLTFAPDAGTYDLELGDRAAGTIEVEAAESDIQVIAASPSEVELIEGEEMHVVGSVYQAGNVAGTEEIELTATNVETGETTVVDSQEVTVAPNVYHLGGLNVSYVPEDAGDYDLELGGRDVGMVTVDERITDIRVVGASLSTAELIEGEELSVTGSVYQNGSHTATEEIELTATETETGESTVIGSQEVTLQPGYYHLGAINITYVPDAGTYDLELGDRDAGTIEVEAAESDIEVIAASPSEIELIEGEEMHVVGSVYQSGNVAGLEQIELTATNTETGETTVVGSQEVTVAPNVYHLGGLNVSYVPEEAGTYDLELGDRDVGTIEVQAAESDIEVIAASPSEVELVEGEEMHVVGSVYQAGNVEGTEEIELTVTNVETGETSVVGTQEVTAYPNVYYLGALNVSYVPEDAGTYDLELGDRDAGTIEVQSAESDLQVVAASPSTVEVTTGEEMHVIGSVYQAGTIAGPETIELTATNTATGETTVVDTQEMTVAPNVYHLGGLNVSYAPADAGTYDLELGDRNAGTVEVVEPTVALEIVAVEGHTSAFDPETETEQVYASEDVPVTVEIDADLDLETVNVLVQSLETNYVRAFEASHDGANSWTATVSPAAIEDDGRYDVSVVAVDSAGNAGTDSADRPLVIDREPPRLSATVEDVDGEGATVVVESDKPLVGPPDVDGVFTAPDGASTESGSVSLHPVGGSDTDFTGSFATGETGDYEITSVGTDRAGNEGTDTASVTVDTRFTLEDGVIEIDETGTAIEFEVADGADEAVLTQDLFVSLSETTANANLDDDQLGVDFITADLDSLLEYHLDQGTVESASISMSIDDENLPDGAVADDVELHYYDDESGDWDTVAGSTVSEIDGDPFLTASVSGFSTYGALVPDTESPEITTTTPADGEVFAAGTDTVDVRFEYDDPYSGVDASSVRLEIDGVDRTDHANTSITSSGIEHTLSVEDGSDYDVWLSVTDEAGNEATHATSFEVGSPSTGSSGGGGGGMSPPATGGDGSDFEDETVSDESASDDSDDADAPSDDSTGGTDDERDSVDEAPPVGTDDSATDADSDSIPGFGAGVAILAALLSAFLLSRRAIGR